MFGLVEAVLRYLFHIFDTLTSVHYFCVLSLPLHSHITDIPRYRFHRILELECSFHNTVALVFCAFCNERDGLGDKACTNESDVDHGHMKVLLTKELRPMIAPDHLGTLQSVYTSSWVFCSCVHEHVQVDGFEQSIV
jgi:hypothetical protein